jgi:acyl carrier protein
MQRHELVDLIAKIALEHIRLLTGIDGPKMADERTRLFGHGSYLDSMALVSLILDVESALKERFGVTMTLADDRAMAQGRSPFRTVGALADYILRLEGAVRT